MPKSEDRELRFLARKVERRAADGKMTITGYAAIFGEVADIGGYFRETIARGAFTNSLRTEDVRAYFGHDPNRVLGRMSTGTLRVSEDDKGLAVEIDLPDTTDGRDASTLIDRGDISGMSFRFEAVRQEWDETGDIPLRTLLEVRIGEVSITAEPAYEGTSIAMRSREAARQEDHPAHKRISERRAVTEQRIRRIDQNPASPEVAR